MAASEIPAFSPASSWQFIHQRHLLIPSSPWPPHKLAISSLTASTSPVQNKDTPKLSTSIRLGLVFFVIFSFGPAFLISVHSFLFFIFTYLLFPSASASLFIPIVLKEPNHWSPLTPRHRRVRVDLCASSPGGERRGAGRC